MQDPWLSGIGYEKFMGRWSTLVAQKFLNWLAVSPARSWLDIGCGTGSLTKVILEKYQPEEIISIDPSSDFISHAQRSITDPRVHFVVGLAQSLAWIRIPWMPLFPDLFSILFHNLKMQSRRC